MPIHIKLQYSRLLGIFVLFSHIGALILTMLMLLSVWTTAFLIILILFSLYRTMNEHVLLASNSAVTELNWDSADVWTLTTQDGEKRVLQLLPTSFVHPALVVLNFKLPDKKRSVVLLKDSVEKDQLRRLCVRLKTTNAENSQKEG